MTKFNQIFEEVLEKVQPSEERLKVIDKCLKEFVSKVEKRLKALKIDAEVFVGGSYAKKTLIKKDKYDVDVFVRFNKKYSGRNLSEILAQVLKSYKVSKVKGSRNYFRVKPHASFFIEVIPVINVSKPKDAENITDLSYSHVKYINRKIKSKALLDEIRITKAFCYANKCYGAESYIKGFSGYALELLVYHYGGFLKFIRAISKANGAGKIVIDSEKHHKNKKTVLLDINASKLNSPIILIDPTYKQRNAAAALSEETFEKFKKICKKFLKSPSIKFFEEEKTDLEKIKKDAKKKNYEFILIEAITGKQEGDIAGNKLLKFYNHLAEEISRFFEIKKKGFNYNDKKAARFYFVVKKKKEILSKGPSVKDKKHLSNFKKKHKNCFVKNGRVYARKKVVGNIAGFLGSWKKKNKKKIKDMYVNGLRII